MPDLEKLATEYKKSGSVRLAHVDCTNQDSTNLCRKHIGAQAAYPTFKVYKHKTGGDELGETVSRANTYEHFKKFMDKLEKEAGSSCSLKDTSGCDEDEAKVLGESQKMSASEREAKLKKLHASMVAKSAETQKPLDEISDLTKKMNILKLADKKQSQGLDDEDKALYEEAVKLSDKDRKDQSKSLWNLLRAKREEAKAVERDVKEIQKAIVITKIGGGMPPESVSHLTSHAQFSEHCEARTCVVVFLSPMKGQGHVLQNGVKKDAGEKKRIEELKVADALFRQSKGASFISPIGFMWAQGGNQKEAEKQMGVKPKYPALAVINIKKQKFALYDGKYKKEALSNFLKTLMSGKVNLKGLPAGMTWATTESAEADTKQEL